MLGIEKNGDNLMIHLVLNVKLAIVLNKPEVFESSFFINYVFSDNLTYTWTYAHVYVIILYYHFNSAQYGIPITRMGSSERSEQTQACALIYRGL